MQGAGNSGEVKRYLSSTKPAVLCLQETRIKEDNKKDYEHHNYNRYMVEPDLVTFVRKDIKT